MPRPRPGSLPCGECGGDSPRTRVTFGGRWRPGAVLDRHVGTGATIAPLTAADAAALDRALSVLVADLRLDVALALADRLDVPSGPQGWH